MAKTGRPTKLTDEVRAQMLQDARDGLTLTGIAFRCRVHPDTLRKWLLRGEKEDSGPFHEFFWDFKAAEAEAEKASTDRMREGERGWQGPATWLERRRPGDYRRRTEVKQEVTGKDGGPVKAELGLDLSGLSIEQLEAIGRWPAGSDNDCE